jgi:DNA-binding transcriptional LysR family regulator
MRHSTIDFESLRYLLVSSEIGKLGKAAEVLGVETSTLSRRLAQVEDELGVTLFERGHFGIRLTAAGKGVMVHVRRLLADLEAVKMSGRCNGSGNVGEIRVGVRMPPVGEPIQSLLSSWHARYPQVGFELHEMNERDILTALEERRLDVAFMTKHTLWPHAVAEPIYRERLLAALPTGHPLATRKTLKWDILRDETFLVQGWEESQTAREFFASFLGSGVRFQSHAASKQSILALVGSGFGVTLVTRSQSHVRFPGVVFRQILEDNAWVAIDLVWAPESEAPVVGRFVAFMRDEAHSRHLV